MAKFMFKGLDELESQLSQLATSDSIRAVCGATIYAGADVVANEIRKGIDALPVVDHRVKGSEDHKIAGLTSAQKKGLQESFGITPLSQEDGYYNVKLGFDGYNSVRTKKYPGGQPNSMIARSVNSGTSFRQKIPFVDTAVRKAKNPALQAMETACDDAIKKQIK